MENNNYVFDVAHYNDGRRSRYGEEDNIDLDEVIEVIKEYLPDWSEEELRKFLSEMENTYKMFGDGSFQIKVTKKIMKENLNEIKRLQKLAGLLNENHMDEFDDSGLSEYDKQYKNTDDDLTIFDVEVGKMVLGLQQQHHQY